MKFNKHISNDEIGLFIESFNLEKLQKCKAPSFSLF